MSVSKRVGAVLCVLALLLHLAFFPLRVRATVAAGALTAVGLAVTVSAFLNLAGIYPFNPDTGMGVTFPEWSQDALQALINQYNAIHASSPITDSTVKSFALGSTIAVANAGWNRLRGFVDWIKAEYALADNAEGVELGTVSSGFLSVPFFATTSHTSAELWEKGILLFEGSPEKYIASVSGVNGCWLHSLDTGHYSFAFFSDVSFLAYYGRYNSTVYSVGNSYGHYRNIAYLITSWNSPVPSLLNGDISVYDFSGSFSVNYHLAVREAIDDFLGGASFSGITADTTTVTTPAAPAADSEFTGMQIVGLGQGATVDALEDVVESGVQNREQPTVRQVEVEIQVGTEVDSETGEVTENPVVVTPESVIPAVSEFFVPQEFVDTMLTTIRTKFPFCIPFHVLEIVSAFVVAPSAPVISLTFHDNFSDSDYTISVDLSPWDEVAAVVRQFETMLLLVGFLLNFSKFDPLQYFFGNHVGPIGFHD